jgi:excisionase family DNA binding protein
MTAPSSPSPFPYLTPSEFARRADQSLRTVQRRCADGTIRAHQTAGGHWLIAEAEIDPSLDDLNGRPQRSGRWNDEDE